MSLSAMNGIRRVGHVLGRRASERPRRADGNELDPISYSPPALPPRTPRGTRNPSRMDARSLNGEGENGSYGDVLSPTPTMTSANGDSNGRERPLRERGVGGKERGGRPPKASALATRPDASWDAAPPVPRELGGDTGNVWDVAPVDAVSIGDVINAEKLRAQLEKAHTYIEKLESQHSDLRKRRSDSEADCGRLRAQLEAAKRREAELEEVISRKDAQIASAGPCARAIASARLRPG